MDAEGGLHQPLAEGKGVVVRQGLDVKRMEANLRLDEHESHKRLSKWEDPSSGFQSNSGSDVRLRQQGSAEIIVPTFFLGKD